MNWLPEPQPDGDASAVRTKGQVLSFYRSHCKVINRLLRRDGLSVDEVKKLVLLWTWMDRKDPTCNFIDNLADESMCPTGDAFDQQIIFGRAILNCLQHQDTAAITYTLSTMGLGILDMLEYVTYRDKFVVGMAEFLHTGVPRLIFDHALRGYSLSDGPLDDARREALDAVFDPLPEPQATLEERTLLLRFETSAGPVDTTVVADYFASKWGVGCIEEQLQMVEPTTIDTPEMYLVAWYGRLVFRESTFLQLAIPTNGPALFHIGGRTVTGWVRRVSMF